MAIRSDHSWDLKEWHMCVATILSDAHRIVEHGHSRMFSLLEMMKHKTKHYDNLRVAGCLQFVRDRILR